MKYTKEQLQAMSDFEVNKALAIAQGRYAGAVGDWMPSGVKANDETGFFYSEVDYCNNPSDIMPMAFEYAIGVEANPIRTEWLARTCDISMSSMSFICYIDKNPLRAIACCLILVLQGEKE